MYERNKKTIPIFKQPLSQGVINTTTILEVLMLILDFGCCESATKMESYGFKQYFFTVFSDTLI